MRKPAEQHHQEFQAAMIAWQYPSPGQVRGSPLALVPVLDRWVGEYPEMAEEVQRLAASAAAICLLYDEFEPVSRLTEVGLSASLVGPLSSRRSATGSWLAIAGASAAVQLDDTNQARVLLEQAAELLAPLSPADPLEPYLRMRRHLTAGRLAEAARELGDAEESFGVAAELAAALSTGRRAGELLEAWVEMVYGPDAAAFAEPSREMVAQEVRSVLREASLGLARLSGDPDRAREAIAWCRSDGLPTRETALALDGVLNALPRDEIDPSADALVTAADDLDEPQRSNWLLAVRALQAVAWTSHGDTERAAEVVDDIAQIMPAQLDAIAATMAIAATSRVAQLAGDRERAQWAAELLLTLVNASSEQLERSPLLLRLRAHTESALAGAVQDEISTEEIAAEQTRWRAAALIDALRAPADAPPVPLLRGESEDLRATAGDRIGRLAFALGERADSDLDPVLVLVVQNVGDESLFVCIGADERSPVAVTPPSAAAYQALQAFVAGAERALHVATRPIELEALGRTTFDALPSVVRGRMLRAKTVIVVPDFGGNQDRVPIELLHDGDGFLGLTRVVARCLSLAHALRVLEPPLAAAAPGRHALCLDVPSAPGLAELQFAAAEVEAVRAALRGSGWDAQTLPPPDLQPQNVLELAPLADVLHVACHGDASSGAEALVLGDGARLRAIDIATRHRLRCVTYLNACSLGRGRYVGGGMSRGAAYAFARAGSPAVIASLLPIEDRSAAQLAEAFYEAAHDHPVGEALRRARVEVASQVGPALWSSTILVGNPMHRVEGPAEQRRDRAAALLARDASPSSSELRAARKWSDGHPADLRLRAAIAFAGLTGDGADHERAARLAREIGHDVGEAQALLALADQRRQSGETDGLIDALERLETALEPLRGVWKPAYETHRATKAELDALDPTYQPRTIETYRFDSGMTVNDRSDPAVDAMLSMFDAQYEHESHWRGEPTLAVPDVDAAAFAHNAVVWGYRRRLYESGAESPYADLLTARMVWRQLIPPDSAPALQRVLAGLLHFLWGQHKITHLESWMLRAHTDVLLIAVGRLGQPPDAPSPSALRPYAEEAAAILDRLEPADAEAPSFATMRAALRGADATRAPAPVDSDIGDLIHRCHDDDPWTAADLAAWISGETQRRLAAANAPGGRRDAGLRYRSLFDSLGRHEEGRYWPYLMDGFKDVRDSGGQDLFARWSSALL